jgi:hypothetical protein
MSSIPSIQFNTNIFKLEYLVGMHYLLIPKKIVEQLGGKLSNRLICTINETLMFQCGLVALGDGDAYISLNAKRLKQLGLKAGSCASVALKKDNSKYGMPMPEELNELLNQDKEGEQRFNLLSPGKQRYIIQYVNTVKIRNYVLIEQLC